jgi:hypothetical protein
MNNNNKNNKFFLIIIFLFSYFLISCTSMKSTVVKERYTLSDTDLCQNLIADYEEIQQASNDPSNFSESDLEYYRVLASEIDRRMLDYSQCDKLASDASSKNVTTAVVITAIAALLYAASQESGSANSYTANDYDWDWDYQPANGQWVCRGVQTGQYASLGNCAYDLKNDDRWPN